MRSTTSGAASSILPGDSGVFGFEVLRRWETASRDSKVSLSSSYKNAKQRTNW